MGNPSKKKSKKGEKLEMPVKGNFPEVEFSFLEARENEFHKVARGELSLYPLPSFSSGVELESPTPSVVRPSHGGSAVTASLMATPEVVPRCGTSVNAAPSVAAPEIQPSCGTAMATPPKVAAPKTRPKRGTAMAVALLAANVELSVGSGTTVEGFDEDYIPRRRRKVKVKTRKVKQKPKSTCAPCVCEKVHVGETLNACLQNVPIESELGREGIFFPSLDVAAAELRRTSKVIDAGGVVLGVGETAATIKEGITKTPVDDRAGFVEVRTTAGVAYGDVEARVAAASMGDDVGSAKACAPLGAVVGLTVGVGVGSSKTRVPPGVVKSDAKAGIAGHSAGVADGGGDGVGAVVEECSEGSGFSGSTLNRTGRPLANRAGGVSTCLVGGGPNFRTGVVPAYRADGAPSTRADGVPSCRAGKAPSIQARGASSIRVDDASFHSVDPLLRPVVDFGDDSRNDVDDDTGSCGGVSAFSQ